MTARKPTAADVRSEPSDNDMFTWALLALVLSNVTEGVLSAAWLAAAAVGFIAMWLAGHRRKRAQRRPSTEPR